MRWWATWPMLMAALVTLFAAHASAQDPLPDEPADEAEMNARRVFDAGRNAYDAHRYADALHYFEEAYRLSPRPGLLYNIALAAEQSGNREQAIESFEQYLAAVPDAPNRSEVETRLGVLRGGEAEDTGDGGDDSRGGGGASLPGWILVGAGGAAAIAGVVLIIVGQSDYASVSNAPMDADWADYESAWGRAPILTGTGIALLAAGAIAAGIGVALVVGGGSSESASARLELGPGTLSLRGRF